MNKLKKEWLEDWSVEDIIRSAIEQGILYTGGLDTDILEYNRKLLVERLKELIKLNK